MASFLPRLAVDTCSGTKAVWLATVFLNPLDRLAHDRQVNAAACQGYVGLLKQVVQARYIALAGNANDVGHILDARWSEERRAALLMSRASTLA